VCLPFEVHCKKNCRPIHLRICRICNMPRDAPDNGAGLPVARSRQPTNAGGIGGFVDLVIRRGELAYQTPGPRADLLSDCPAPPAFEPTTRPSKDDPTRSSAATLQYRVSGAANTDCPVCFDEFVPASEVHCWPCGGRHVACVACARDVSAHWGTQCPVCRR